MIIKERIFDFEKTSLIFTREDFINEARPAVFSALDDSQKHGFIRLAKMEQDQYVEAALRDIGIRMPAGL